MSSPEHMAQRIVAIGECMVEISDRPEGCRLGFGGDTLNTALYLARLGMNVDYVTVLGDDPYSNEMVKAWDAEGIGVGFVGRAADRLPGLYAIRTDERGERRFYYWRERAPARELLTDAHAPAVAEALAGAALVYLSGITVSILDDAQRRRLLGLLGAARERGASVAFDPNFRPTGWPDAASARAWFDEFWRMCTHALPSINDERALRPCVDAAELAARLHELGVEEVVVKGGDNGCWVDAGDGLKHIPVGADRVCIDSTAAGDSFNAGYLAARLRGHSREAAALAANRLAGAVVAHPGAIIPREAMPDGGAPRGCRDMSGPSQLLSLLRRHPVIPVVTLEHPEIVPRLADALLAGGIGIVEVTLRSEAGLAAIRRLKQSHASMVVAAGTVLGVQQLESAAQAGADFAVSPGTTAALLTAAQTMAFPYLPGVATAGEAMAAAEAKFDVLKFFPAQAAGGIAMLRGWADPLPHLSFCPTGGVGAGNLADYLALGNVVCVGGSWIATRQALRDGDWAGISARAAAALATAHGQSD